MFSLTTVNKRLRNMNKTVKQAPPLLTAGQLKELLDDVFPDCIVHISGSGAVREIEVRNGKLYIKGYSNGKKVCNATPSGSKGQQH